MMEPVKPEELHQKVTLLPDIRRLLPQAPDAEKGLLCSFLLAPLQIGQLCAEKGLVADQFHIPAHAILFGVLKEFWEENEPIDFIIITAFLNSKGMLANIGGAPFITELFAFLPTAANAATYVEIIQEKFVLRLIILTCTEYTAKSYEEQHDVAGLLFEVQRAIQAIAIGAAKPRRSFKDMIMQVVQSIEDGDEATPDILSGITHLDSLVKMRRGNFIVIGGHAKGGKTALAGTIATNAATVQKKRVLIISLEMDFAEMVKRMLATAGRVNIARIGKEPTQSEFDGVVRGATSLGDASVEIVDDAYDLNAIVAAARKAHLEKPLDLVLIDYLQLIEWSTGRKGETRQEIVAQISRTCKKLASQLRCVLIGLSQLNEDGKLRESRAIGQDANVILGVEKRDDKSRVIRIVDQRNGPSEIDINATWLPWCTTFEDPTEPEEENGFVQIAKEKRPKKKS
jgi:replicative DNA helicase